MMILQATIAQLEAQVVRGIVKDGEGNGLPFATVQLLSLPDSLVIDGGITNNEGCFSIDYEGYQLPLLVRIRLLGYQIVNQSVSSSNPLEITMVEEETLLGEAVITAKKVSHKMVPGGLSTDISLSPLANVSDIYSVLRGVPLLEVKGDEITVTGHGNPIIYINDKPMRDKAQLEQLRPYLIDRVEVLTTPDSRYSSSISAVIKIYTKREKGSGLSGSIRPYLRYQLGCDLSYGGGINLNYRTGAWDFYYNTAYYNQSDAHHNPMLKSYSQVGEDKWSTLDDIKFFNSSRSFQNVFGINFEDELQSAGVRYNLVGYDSKIKSFNNSELVMNGDAPIYYQGETTEKTPWSVSHRPSAYYFRRIGEWSAQIDADFYSYKNSFRQNVKEKIDGASSGLDAISRTTKETISAGVRSELSGAIWGGNLTLGGEYTWVENKYSALNDKAFELPDSRSNTQEKLWAMFAQYALPIGKWQASGGIRMEYVDNEYAQNGKRVDEVSRKSFDVFPSLAFSGELGKGWGAQLSFRSTIRRPAYWLLRPQYQYINKQTYKSGNPFLKPAITYKVEGISQKKWFMAMLGYYYYKSHILDEYSSLMPDENSPMGYRPKTILIIPTQGEPLHRLQMMVNISPKIGFWKPNLSFMLAQDFGFEYWDFEELKSTSKPIVQLSWSNSFSLPREFYLTLNMQSIFMGQNTHIIVDRPFFTSYAEVSKKWLDGKLYTSMGVENLTNSVNMRASTYSRYSRMGVIIYSPTSIKLNVTYRFNNAKSKYRGQGALNSVMDRM